MKLQQYYDSSNIDNEKGRYNLAGVAVAVVAAPDDHAAVVVVIKKGLCGGALPLRKLPFAPA